MTVVASGGETATSTGNVGVITLLADYFGVGDAAIRLLITLFAGK